MRTFVINLPKEKRRLENIWLQLKKLDIEFEVFEAVYWKNLSEKDINEAYDEEKCIKTYWKKMTIWEIWCALSHFWVYKKIVDEKIPIALVLEDDAIISKDIKKYIEEYEKNWTNYEYILLNYWIFDKKEIVRYWKYIYQNFLKQGKYFKFIVHFFWIIFFTIIDHILIWISKIIWSFIIKKYRPAYLMAWYFITYEWAKKLLSVNNKIFLPSDVLPERFWKKIWLKFALSIPNIVIQDVWAWSTIDELEKRIY